MKKLHGGLKKAEDVYDAIDRLHHKKVGTMKKETKEEMPIEDEYWEVFGQLTTKQQNEYLWHIFGEMLCDMVREWDRLLIMDGIAEMRAIKNKGVRK